MDQTRHRVILDVDTGVDDACALLLGGLDPGVDLVAVTCVAGNAPLRHVVRNTLTVLDALGRRDVPVAAGADGPLLAAARDSRHVHGRDGMGDLGWPPSTRSAEPLHAVELLRDLLRDAVGRPQQERISLVMLAPLTNLALLLRMYPDVAHGIRQIVMMGGAMHVSEVTATAEFNVWQDPEAAAIVLAAASAARIDIVMYGLDVFYDVRVSRKAAQRGLRRAPAGSVADLAGRLVLFQCDRFGTDSATLGDAGALCAALDPDGLTTVRTPVKVQLTGSLRRGRTVVDLRAWRQELCHDPDAPPVAWAQVAVAVEGDRYARLWLDRVLGGP